MNSQNNTNPQNPWISGETVLAIISVALGALWIAFAYYKGNHTDADGHNIMLLHPLVPICLIALLIRIHKWVGIKFIVYLEIVMICLWLFIRLLGVLMPFILGFGFAYLFRFLWKALPFKKSYQRSIATVLIIVVCTSVLIFTCIGVGYQLGQMTKGLQKFYHEALLPAVVGETYKTITSDIENGTETLFLGTNHGVYIIPIDKDTKDEKTKQNDSKKKETEPKRMGITNGELVGKNIQTIAVNEKYIFAATTSSVYRCSKNIVKAATGKIKESLIAPSEELLWTEINTTSLGTRRIQTINTPSWNPSLIYIGTERGLYKSEDAGEKWQNIKIDGADDASITSITSIEKYVKNRMERVLYLSCIDNTQQQLENSDDSKIKTNSIFWKLSDFPMAWTKANTEILNAIDGKLPQIQTLVATNKEETELYVGTIQGLYETKNIEIPKWIPADGSNGLPESIQLFTSTPVRLYAGNDNTIHYRTSNSTSWKPLIKKKPGILIYRDQPIVKEFQAYLTERIPGWTASGGALIKWLSGLAGSIAFQFGGFIATFFLALIVFAYACQGLDHYFNSLINTIPEKHRNTIRTYFLEIDNNMQQFLKGQFTVIVIVSIISCIVYQIIGVPFALLIGILAGLCNAIPTFGPFIGGGFALIAMLMGLAAGEFTGIDFLVRSLFVLGAILGIQTIDNSVISPKVMSSAVDVDPLLIMFAVIVGASILGFWGVLLAIPIIVVIKSIVSVSKSGITEADA
ncbi:AI-2E family transporter [Candidatus Poribacteria bacterium]|nr:AI-2E family transporter [Candidatus Poribacteria bacterium]